MEGFKAFLRGEPVLTVNVVSAAIILAATFGFSLPVGAAAAVYGVVTAVSAFVARSKVSPV